MIQDNPISLGYWGDPKLTKKLSTKGRAVKTLVTLQLQAKALSKQAEQAEEAQEEAEEYLAVVTELFGGDMPADFVIPEGVTEINTNLVGNYWNTFSSITLPSTLESIGYSTFSGMIMTISGTQSVFPNIICLAETPPDMSNGLAFGPTVHYASSIDVSGNYYYVPDDSVDAYKAATGWTSLASYIVPLSTYPKD